MLKALLLYVKYPSVAGIIAVMWISSGILLVYYKELPVVTIMYTNIFVSLVIGLIGFRVDKK